MTWFLDPETGEVLDDDGKVWGTVDGPPFSIPDDVREVAVDQFLPNTNASVRGVHLEAVLAISSNDVEFGRPENTDAGSGESPGNS